MNPTPFLYSNDLCTLTSNDWIKPHDVPAVHEFLLLDLSIPEDCVEVLTLFKSINYLTFLTFRFDRMCDQRLFYLMDLVSRKLCFERNSSLYGKYTLSRWIIKSTLNISDFRKDYQC